MNEYDTIRDILYGNAHLPNSDNFIAEAVKRAEASPNTGPPAKIRGMAYIPDPAPVGGSDPLGEGEHADKHRAEQDRHNRGADKLADTILSQDYT